MLHIFEFYKPNWYHSPMAERLVGNIWHVEDDRTLRESISSLLRREGHDVLSTASFQEAEALIPDGVKDRDIGIFDGSLGDGTGDALIQLVRKSGLTMAIVGLSTRIVEGADISLNKLKTDSGILKETVQDLLAKPR